MIRTVRLTPIPVLMALCLSLAMGGCGSKAANQPDALGASPSDYTSPSSDPTMTGVYSAPASSDSATTSSALPTPAPTPTATAPVSLPTTVPVTPPVPVSTPTPAPSQAPIDLAYALRATILNPQIHGILMWKRLTATVEVQNPSFLKQQSGTAVVTFTLNGNVVETQQLAVALNPAEIRDYSVQSTKNADAATVDVTTSP